MARNKVIIGGSRPWRCPICDSAGLSGKKNFPTDRALAQHIAMMDGARSIRKEGPHKDWRREKGISPVEYETMKKPEVPKMIEQILQIINANLRSFKGGGE